MDLLGDVVKGACNLGIYHTEIVEQADPEFNEARRGVDLVEAIPEYLPGGGSCCLFCPRANVGSCLKESTVYVE
jgi:hypothetical protein